jgi:hypothetical protein
MHTTSAEEKVDASRKATLLRSDSFTVPHALLLHQENKRRLPPGFRRFGNFQLDISLSTTITSINFKQDSTFKCSLINHLRLGLVKNGWCSDSHRGIRTNPLKQILRNTGGRLKRTAQASKKNVGSIPEATCPPSYDPTPLSSPFTAPPRLMTIDRSKRAA